MSTVLWANLLVDGKVESQEADQYALYKHADALDKITRKLRLPSFLDLCDTTDIRFNASEFELPEGCESTTEVMAAEGVWLPLPDGIRVLEGLLDHIVEKNIRFGLLKNAHAAVVDELNDVLSFARSGAPRAQMFNFSIVT
jgi:hypothetical protein